MEIDQQRLYLVREIEKYRPHGSSRNLVTLIFDGRPGRAQPIQSSVVSVKFSYDMTADDQIKNAVDSAKNAKNFIIITDDREIQYSVRANGAKVMPVKEFLSKLNSGSSGTKRAPSSRGISKGRVDEINAELEQIWIKKKKK